ncbi:MAG TPA: acetyltransferase [Usitatibacter sp.]|nr:acetyltransferase [Usitatibacter sp.]
MRYFDVFNGDADGICALHQLRLADPVDSELVTGLKRDIALLDSVDARSGDIVTVLDLSLERNRAALVALLERGAHVRYFDHHYAGEIPRHPDLEAAIDDSRAACTSALIDRHLGGRFRAWAVVGAFGDEVPDVAMDLAKRLGLDAARLAALRELGVSINYNAYGSSAADVLVHPRELYRIVSHYEDPFEMIARERTVEQLAARRRADLEQALAVAPARAAANADAYVLPEAAWSRRVIGTFANRLAAERPERAHAVLAPSDGGAYVVSVRAPRTGAGSAAEFCRRYSSGGGRAAAGGIDRLEATRVAGFLDEFARAWSA